MRTSPALIVVVVALVVAACTGATPPTPIPSADPPDTTASASAPPAGSLLPAGSTPPADAAGPSPGMPPDALLAGGADGPVAGALGSFTWGEAGSDAPWLPGTPVSVRAGEELAVELAGVAVEHWRARYGAGRGPDTGKVEALGEGNGSPVFGAPPAGSWTVAVDVTFADGRGSAVYYWRLTVS